MLLFHASMDSQCFLFLFYKYVFPQTSTMWLEFDRFFFFFFKVPNFSKVVL